MNSDRILAIALRQYYLMRGNFPRIAQLFSWVLVDIVVWGFMTKYLNGLTGSAHNFVPALLGAVLLWDFLIRVMQGTATTYMEDSWSRNLYNMFASPVSIGEYIGGVVLSSTIGGLISLAVMLALATAIFGLSMFAYGLATLPFLLILFLTGIALGILSIGIMLRFGPSAEWLVWPLPAVLSPFCGVFYPVATLPGWMQAVGYTLPPTYVFEGIRAIVAGNGITGTNLLIGLALSIFYILLASLFFAKIHKLAVKTGLIARYSTESTS